MTTWPTIKIGEIAKVKGGKRLPQGFGVQDIKTNYPYIRVTDMSSGQLVTDNVKYIENEAYKLISQYTISSDDLYISIAGTIGMVGKVPHELSGANLTENAAKITEFNEKFNRDFLLYYLISKDGQFQIKQRIGGSTQPKLALNRIETIAVSFPSLSTQTQISAALSTYDDLIKNNEKRIKILEEMALLLYTEWFVKFNFPGHKNIKMIDSRTEYGMIPEGWEVKKLGALIDVRGGLSYKNEFLTDDNTQLPLITMGCIHSRSTFNFSGLGYYSGEYGGSHVVKGGDLVMATRDVTSERKILGSPAIVPRNFKTAIAATNVYIVDNKNGELNNQFLYLLFRSPAFRNRMIGHAKGTNILMIVKDSVLGFNFVNPEESIINKFAGFIAPIFDELDKLETENQNLSKTRDHLIPQLVTGKRELKN